MPLGLRSMAQPASPPPPGAAIIGLLTRSHGVAIILQGGVTMATRGPRSSLPRWPAGPGEAAIIHGMSQALFQQFPLLVLCEQSRGSWPVARMTAGGIRRSAGHLGINMRPQPFLPLPSFLCLSLPSFFASCDPMPQPLHSFMF